MHVFQIDSLNKSREEAFVLLAVTGGLFLASLILIGVLILRRRSKNQFDEEALPAEVAPSPKSPATKASGAIAMRKPIDAEVETAVKTTDHKAFMPQAEQKVSSSKEIQAKSSLSPGAGAANAQGSLKVAQKTEKSKEDDTSKTNGSAAPEMKTKEGNLNPVLEKQKTTPAAATTPKQTEKVLQDVNQAIKGHSKEENMAKLTAYLEELQGKRNEGAEKPTPPEPSKKSESRDVVSKAEATILIETKAVQDPSPAVLNQVSNAEDLPTMPLGSLEPPFVPQPIFPEGPSVSSIQDSFSKIESVQQHIAVGEPKSNENKEIGAMDEPPEEKSQMETPTDNEGQVNIPDTNPEKPKGEDLRDKTQGAHPNSPLLVEEKAALPEVREEETPRGEENAALGKNEKETLGDTSPKGQITKGTMEVKKETGLEKKSKMKTPGNKGGNYRSFVDWLRQTKGNH